MYTRTRTHRCTARISRHVYGGCTCRQIHGCVILQSIDNDTSVHSYMHACSFRGVSIYTRHIYIYIYTPACAASTCTCAWNKVKKQNVKLSHQSGSRMCQHLSNLKTLSRRYPRDNFYTYVVFLKSPTRETNRTFSPHIPATSPYRKPTCGGFFSASFQFSFPAFLITTKFFLAPRSMLAATRLIPCIPRIRRSRRPGGLRQLRGSRAPWRSRGPLNLLRAGDVLPCSSLSQLVMTVAAVFAFNHSSTDEQVVIEPEKTLARRRFRAKGRRGMERRAFVCLVGSAPFFSSSWKES